jgi:hypothetical protein
LIDFGDIDDDVLSIRSIVIFAGGFRLPVCKAPCIFSENLTVLPYFKSCLTPNTDLRLLPVLKLVVSQMMARGEVADLIVMVWLASCL